MKLGLMFETKPSHPVEGLPRDIYAEMETVAAIEDLSRLLEEKGHTIYLIDFMDQPLDRLRECGSSLDVVFNYSVGFGSRSRETLPAALCELHGLPCTGSDPMALAIASNKHASKLFARHCGIRTPAWQVVPPGQSLQMTRLPEQVLLKPCWEGSSIGIVGPIGSDSRTELHRTIEALIREYRQPVVVEEFIEGAEVTIPILGWPTPRTLDPVALALAGSTDLGQAVFDSQLKQDDESDHNWTREVPIDSARMAELARSSLLLFEAIGCDDIGRADYRVDSRGEPYFLELNLVPSLSPQVGAFATAGKSQGLDVPEIVEEISRAAIDRWRGDHSHIQSSKNS